MCAHRLNSPSGLPPVGYLGSFLEEVRIIQVPAGHDTLLEDMDPREQEFKLWHYTESAEDIVRVPRKQTTKALKVVRRMSTGWQAVVPSVLRSE